MLSLFANPFTMVAGALLISSPIIIHLINRMRFKRIRWAAMEFLLKSQKRNRRKLIIEQMILLALRILMVLLVGLLLARFVGCNDVNGEGAQTFHVILIDDTLSTSDTIRGQDGQSRAAFEEAKRVAVEQVAGQAAQATSPQYCTVVLLSDLDHPRQFGRLNPTAVEDMRTYLAPFKPSLRHVELTDGLKTAKKMFDDERSMSPVLHVVGDFRGVDWSDRNKDSFGKAFEELTTAGVKPHLIDCVTPERTPQQKTPLASDNLAIVDVAPDARIVPKNKEVEFTVRVHNYSNSEKKAVFLRTRVNGQIREDGSVAIPSVPPNGEAVAKINLGSGLQRGAEDESEDGENAGMPLRFNLVSVHLEGETGGIEADNTRYTVVEVRDRVPILIVDNNPTARGTKEAESFFLQKLFTEPIKGYDVQLKSAADLENLNLQPYASVYLCDVPRLSDNARKNLEDYVKGGGGLAFFMGPSIKSDVIAEYNDKLYRKGEGVFPVPLDKLVGVDVPEDKRIAEKIRRTFTFNKKLLVRRDMQNHPALEKLYKDNRGQAIKEDEYEKFFNFVVIDRYVSVNQQQLRGGLGGVETLVYLQNTKPIDSYTKAVNTLTDRLNSRSTTRSGISTRTRSGGIRGELRKIAGSTAELYQLGEALDAAARGRGDEATRPARPGGLLGPRGQRPAQAKDFEKLRDEVKYGDPLYVAKPFGKGRVVAFMTVGRGVVERPGRVRPGVLPADDDQHAGVPGQLRDGRQPGARRRRSSSRWTRTPTTRRSEVAVLGGRQGEQGDLQAARRRGDADRRQGRRRTGCRRPTGRTSRACTCTSSPRSGSRGGKPNEAGATQPGLPGPAVQRGRPGRGEPGPGELGRHHADGGQGPAARAERPGRLAEVGPPGPQAGPVREPVDLPGDAPGADLRAGDGGPAELPRPGRPRARARPRSAWASRRWRRRRRDEWDGWDQWDGVRGSHHERPGHPGRVRVRLPTAHRDRSRSSAASWTGGGGWSSWPSPCSSASPSSPGCTSRTRGPSAGTGRCRWLSCASPSTCSWRSMFLMPAKQGYEQTRKAVARGRHPRRVRRRWPRSGPVGPGRRRQGGHPAGQGDGLPGRRAERVHQGPARQEPRLRLPVRHPARRGAGSC